MMTMNKFFDFALYLYLYEILVCFSTFVLFVWYSVYKYRLKACIPSALYVAVGLFFLSQAYAVSIGFAARLARSESAWNACPFLDTQIWHTRVFFRVAMETVISVLQARKVYIEMKRKGKELRRFTDQDGEDV